MAYIWMFGALIFYFRHEWRKQGNAEHLPELTEQPPVSILIPCYNEGENVRETVEILLRQKYPAFEIIAVNDGSKDNTLEILQELAEQHSQLRVVNLHTNQGKAMGLRTAALLANSEILICIDGDALLAPEAIAWMVRHFLDNPKCRCGHRQPAHPQPFHAVRPDSGRRILGHRRHDQAGATVLRAGLHRLRRYCGIPQIRIARCRLLEQRHGHRRHRHQLEVTAGRLVDLFRTERLVLGADAGNPARLMEATDALGAGRNRSVAALFSPTCFAGRRAACGCYTANA